MIGCGQADANEPISEDLSHAVWCSDNEASIGKLRRPAVRRLFWWHANQDRGNLSKPDVQPH